MVLESSQIHTWSLGDWGTLKTALEWVRPRKERKRKADDIQVPWQAAGTLACQGVWDTGRGSRVGIPTLTIPHSLIRAVPAFATSRGPQSHQTQHATSLPKEAQG